MSSVSVSEKQPGCLITLLWFIFVGWWASALWSAVAWFFVVTIIGMPIGLMMINRLPMIATLRRPANEYRVTQGAAGATIDMTAPRQRPFLLRALWFLLIGWWLSGIFLAIAWGASATIIFIPAAIWIYNRIPAITTLARY